MNTIKSLLLIASLSLFTLACSKSKSEKAEAAPDAAAPKVDYYEALQGAWTTKDRNMNGEELTVTTIVMDGYIAESFYNVDRKEFSHTFGGSWTVENNTFKFLREFSSTDTSAVGTVREVDFYLKGDTITFDGDDRIWTRIDNGQSGKLSGAWLITGRERDGEMTKWTPGPRKTMKILSDTRFQWVAFNTETKEFFGTGGGTYTAKDNEYIENIEFYSRDSSRVGASLSFEFNVENKEWHHKGLSSKGDPIYEIWTLRTELEK